MSEQREQLAPWTTGPRGFLPKANQTIDAVNSLRRGAFGPFNVVPSTRSVGVFAPVWLTQTGGSAGSVSTACTFTYSVFSDAVKSNQIGTAIEPEHARPALGPMVAASIGLAGIIDGELKLWWTDEVPDVEACPS